MIINDMFQSKYLKGIDLVNKIVNVIIEGITFTDEFDEGRKYILSFKGAKKSLMLNKTNVGILQWLFPDVTDSDGWVGKEIQLYTELVTFRGQTGPAIRIRGTAGVFQPTSDLAAEQAASAPIQSGNSQPGGPGEQAKAEVQKMPTEPSDMHPDVMDDPIPF